MPRNHIDLLLYSERAIDDIARERHFPTLTQFEEKDKEEFRNAEDLQYFIDTRGIRERLGDEYKLED